MLWMITERVRPGSDDALAERFATRGRLLPEGVEYLQSWPTPDGSLCYQLMRAPDRAALEVWIARWSDLVDFEAVRVETSEAHWARRRGPGDRPT